MPVISTPQTCYQDQIHTVKSLGSDVGMIRFNLGSTAFCYESAKIQRTFRSLRFLICKMGIILPVLQNYSEVSKIKQGGLQKGLMKMMVGDISEPSAHARHSSETSLRISECHPHNSRKHFIDE